MPSDVVEHVKQLSKHIPRNQFGLPEGIYRADLLSAHSDVEIEEDPINDVESNGTVGQSLPETYSVQLADELTIPLKRPHRPDEHVAYVSLSYVEGFPTLMEDSAPFWARFDWEPPEAFARFEDYLIQGEAGARQLYLLETTNGGSTTPSELFHLFYWSDRVKAYDLFRIAEFRKRQYHRGLSLDDDHFTKASTLFDMVMKYFTKEDGDFLDTLTPKVAIDLLKAVTQMQRVSAGLPGLAPVDAAKKAGFSLEVALEGIAGARVDPNSVQGTVIDESGQRLEAALNDPKAAALAQKLIITLNQSA